MLNFPGVPRWSIRSVCSMADKACAQQPLCWASLSFSPTYAHPRNIGAQDTQHVGWAEPAKPNSADPSGCSAVPPAPQASNRWALLTFSPTYARSMYRRGLPGDSLSVLSVSAVAMVFLVFRRR